MTPAVIATIKQALHDAEIRALQAHVKSDAHRATYWQARLAEIKVAQDAISDEGAS